MRKILIGFVACFMFVSGLAWGHDAMDFYKRGLNSYMAYQKIDYFSKALELDPRLSDAYEGRGMLYFDQGKYDASIQDFKRVVELKPFEPGGYMMLGLAHIKKEDYDKAVVYLNRTIELDPRPGRAYSYISEAYRQKGMPAEAIRNASKAIELGAKSTVIGRAYATRAKSYRSLGNLELAEEDFTKALQLAPEYRDYTFFTATEFLADLAAESSNLKRVGLTGFFMIVSLAFVGIFRLVLPAPQKDEDRSNHP